MGSCDVICAINNFRKSPWERSCESRSLSPLMSVPMLLVGGICIMVSGPGFPSAHRGRAAGGLGFGNERAVEREFGKRAAGVGDSVITLLLLIRPLKRIRIAIH